MPLAAAIIEVAVALMALQAIGIHRLAGIACPLWSHRSGLFLGLWRQERI
jgi:hypothetical protein